MLTPIITIPIGFVLGFLAGLGVGGGSLLIIWLTLVADTPHGDARAINLMFFLIAAGSVSLFRMKKGNFDFHSTIPAVIGGCIAALICSWIGKQIDSALLKKAFGILLLFTGLREVFYRPRKAK